MSVNKYNSEGYIDPTAYEALTIIEKEVRAKKAYRPVVYVCSPLTGDVERNTANAKRYCRFAVEMGCIPIAPHLYFPQFMDDNIISERNLALYMDIILLSKCASEIISPKGCRWRSPRRKRRISR